MAEKYNGSLEQRVADLELDVIKNRTAVMLAFAQAAYTDIALMKLAIALNKGDNKGLDEIVEEIRKHQEKMMQILRGDDDE